MQGIMGYCFIFHDAILLNFCCNITLEKINRFLESFNWWERHLLYVERFSVRWHSIWRDFLTPLQSSKNIRGLVYKQEWHTVHATDEDVPIDIRPQDFPMAHSALKCQQYVIRHRHPPVVCMLNTFQQWIKSSILCFSLYRFASFFLRMNGKEKIQSYSCNCLKHFRKRT